MVELPGLDDPGRIKSLLGKTANLTFQFVATNQEQSFGTELLQYESGDREAIVSKRIIISGDNLVDAKPTMNNQTNQTVVSFSLDRVGARKFGKATSSGKPSSMYLCVAAFLAFSCSSSNIKPRD